MYDFITARQGQATLSFTGSYFCCFSFGIKISCILAELKFLDIWNNLRSLPLLRILFFKRELFNSVEITCVYLRSKCNWITKLSRKLSEALGDLSENRPTIFISSLFVKTFVSWKKKLSGYKNSFPYTIPLSERKLQNIEEISTDDKMPWKITFPF